MRSKTILVTGASRGIGEAVARLFLAEQWAVIGTFCKHFPSISSESFSAVKLDLADSCSIAAANQEIRRLKCKSIDALVNNAAVLLDGDETRFDVATIRATFEVNLFGVIEFTESILPLLGTRTQIVNVSSVYGALSFPVDNASSLGYRASKAALNMYTRVFAHRLRERDVRVSAVDPGWVMTDMGLSTATKIERPDRTSEDAARDIYDLVMGSGESGSFWKAGKRREW